MPSRNSKLVFGLAGVLMLAVLIGLAVVIANSQANDRTDIKELVNLLDDSIDQMQKTAKAITLFEVETFEPEMKEMGAIIVRAADKVIETVALLGSLRDDHVRLNALGGIGRENAIIKRARVFHRL